jgi:ribonucleoside-triphosphate reductase (thioredoxin)
LEKTPRRFRAPGTTDNEFALSGFKHLQEVAGSYNHRVKSIRLLAEKEPVYNLTVDDNHTVGVITDFSVDTGKCDGILVSQCVEQTLEDRELCCLVENFPANCDNLEDFLDALKWSYLYAKTVTLIPTHDSRANEVMIRNARIGTSLSGVQQAISAVGHGEFRKWQLLGYDRIQELDAIYSDWLGVRRSIKTTSIKPSGTVSLLPGSTPGIHRAISEYYIRNIRVTSGSSMVPACIAAGYKVEPCMYAPNTSVVSFPVKEVNFSKGATETTIWEQFQMAAEMQRYWADNQVSATIYFHEHEKKDIAACLAMYDTSLKGISLLPHTHGYVQAPIIPITKEEYEDMLTGLRPLVLNGSTHEVDDKFCDGDKCII